MDLAPYFPLLTVLLGGGVAMYWRVKPQNRVDDATAWNIRLTAIERDLDRTTKRAESAEARAENAERRADEVEQRVWRLERQIIEMGGTPL